MHQVQFSFDALEPQFANDLKAFYNLRRRWISQILFGNIYHHHHNHPKPYHPQTLLIEAPIPQIHPHLHMQLVIHITSILKHHNTTYHLAQILSQTNMQTTNPITTMQPSILLSIPCILITIPSHLHPSTPLFLRLIITSQMWLTRILPIFHNLTNSFSPWQSIKYFYHVTS